MRVRASATNGRPAARRRPFASPLTVGALVATVLLCTGLGVVWLQKYTDQRRTSQLVLADLELDTARLRGIALAAGAAGSLPTEFAREAQAVSEHLDAASAEATRAYPGDDELARTVQSAVAVRRTVAAQLRLIAEGRLVEASALGRDQVEPTFNGFAQRIYSLRADAGRRAEDAAAVANAGTFAVLLIAAGVLLLLLRRFDVASRRAREAFIDPLTGIANRMLFGDRLTHALAVAERRHDEVAVLFLDLDDFKTVNDSLGHACGDQLLIETGQRVKDSSRASDTVARLGGDEFALLLEGVGEEGAERVAERIRETLSTPFELAGRSVIVNGTVGYAIGRPGITQPDELLRNADLAMYAGKRQGKARAVKYDDAMYQALADRVELESDLRGAISRGEISLAYQPIVEVGNGRLTAVEALARWSHPTRGDIGPTTFIPIAEETGVIREIGRWALREACTQAKRWQDGRDPGDPLSVTVNVSPAQFGHDELVGDVQDALSRSGLTPRLLTLEITESVLVDRGDAFIGELEELSKLGIRIAVDDFGTGYSSLSSLSRFPVDVLKIDRSFVIDVEDDEEGQALVRSIVDLGRSLGLVAVAEGIEDTGQLDALRDAGCDLGQGFHIARPMDADAVDALLAEKRSAGAAAPPDAEPRPEPEPPIRMPGLIRPPRAA